MNKIKKFIKNKIPLVYKVLIKLRSYVIGFSRSSYSLAGEDLVLSTFLDNDGIKNGFYVDIGAYQPKRFSNTYFYYKKGWSGINIDAKPGSMEPFMKQRSKDINLEVGISREEKELDFYVFNESAYNTFSKDLANVYINRDIPLIKKVVIETKRLDNILDKYIPKNQVINFMTIDVEGFDLEVLESNNWNKYKPSYILIEMQDFDIENIKESDIYRFLINKGYKLVSIAYISLIFKYELVSKI